MAKKETTIEDVKGQAHRISELTGELYQAREDPGASNGWQLVHRVGNEWMSITFPMPVAKLRSYLTGFIHGAEVVARRYRK